MAMEHYTNEDIVEYFDKHSDYFPSHYKKPSMTEKGGYNSCVMVLTLSCLEDIDPIEYEDAKFFGEEFRVKYATMWSSLVKVDGSKAHTYRKSRRKDRGDSAMTFPVAAAIAVYGYVTGMSVSLTMALGEAAFKSMPQPSPMDKKCGRLFLYMVTRLLQEGYFGIEHLQHLHDMDLFPPDLMKVAEEMIAHPVDYEYLSGSISEDLLQKLGYSELALADVFFYMLRVDTASRNKGFASPARAQWAPMLCRASVDLADLCFCFAVVCTSSEQLKAFIIKQLRESTEFSGYLLELFEVFRVKCYHGKAICMDSEE